jgi:hypothetical protein
MRSDQTDRGYRAIGVTCHNYCVSRPWLECRLNWICCSTLVFIEGVVSQAGLCPTRTGLREMRNEPWDVSNIPDPEKA